MGRFIAAMILTVTLGGWASAALEGMQATRTSSIDAAIAANVK